MVKKTYVLGMFPYPSGEGLHVGHVRIFTACDVMARYFRMKANKDSDPSTLPRQARDRSGSSRELSVLSPMGWDAFGLPAENAAIKFKKIPQEMVPHNYANFKKQMQNLSLDFDWSREFATTDPEYYAITQWIFLKLYKKGLVYRDEVAINWCPKCKTGLANEEVMADGTHERCGSATGKKLLPQWVMKITEYAERLLNDLDGDSGRGMPRPYKSTKLDWPRGIIEMQKNWIGKKEGVRVKFKFSNPKFSNSQIEELEVFTTRIDTIYGVTFVVISPEKAQEWMKNGWKADKGVVQYIEQSLAKSQQTRLGEAGEKTGVDTGIKAVNPANSEEVPVWVADYVLSDVGTGAVMGVPFFDERDKAFATKFDLPIKEIECDETILEKLEKMGVAKRETTYHLRDWVFSRQRYWGEPIPLVYCDKCGVVPLREDQLPLTLPELKAYEPTDTGESPLARVTDWVNTKCPQCGGPATRETDTMPNWAGSCWYFLAFAFWGKVQLPAGPGPAGKQPYTDWWMKTALPEIKKWLPVDWYLGGAEHAVLHLLYARFWVKVLQDLGLLDFPEPFLRLRSVGMVLAEDGKKMSKSLGNVVNPDDMVEKYGSDAVRMYEMFMGPWEQSIAWDSGAISGQVRFLGRILETVKMAGKTGEKTSPLLAAKLKTLVARVEDGVLNQKFNTSIAGLMEWVNAWRAEGSVVSKEHLGMFASLLSLFAPKSAHSLWLIAHSEAQGEPEWEWPDVKSFGSLALARDLRVTIAVQVNGKLRTTLMVDGKWAMDKDKVVDVVMKDEKVKKWIVGEPSKIIFVPGRLVNLVI